MGVIMCSLGKDDQNKAYGEVLIQCMTKHPLTSLRLDYISGMEIYLNLFTV